VADVIGTALIRIMPDTSGFSGAINSQMAGVTGGLTGASSAAGGLADSLTGAGKAMEANGQAMAAQGSKLTRGVTLPILGIGAAMGKVAFDFDTSMRQVAAVTGESVTEVGGGFEKLSDLAKELGRTTQFSAAQAAEGMGFLAMAGFETTAILDAMPGVLNLAAAGNMDLAEAADIASNVLSGYGMKAAEIGRINDVMAQTFTSSNTSLSQMGEALKFVAPVAQASGAEFEEAAAALGLLGNAGIQGSLGGTTLRGVYAKLQAPTSAASEAIDRLGVSVFDSAGQMKPLVDIIGDFEKAGLSTADAMTIFGLRAGPGFQALVSQGSAALDELTQANRRAGGEIEAITETIDLTEKQIASLNGAFDMSRQVVLSYGVNVDESTAFLGAFAREGKTAKESSDALTSAIRATSKDGFESLIGATRDAQGNLTDAEGNVLTFLDAMEALAGAGVDTATMMDMFGDEAEGLIATLGVTDEKMMELVDATSSAGRAAEIAEIQMSGIRGSMLRMKSAAEGVAIAIFSGGLLDGLAGLAEKAAAILQVIAELDPRILNTVVAMAALAAAIGPLVWIIGKMRMNVGLLLQGLGFLAKHPVILVVAALAAALKLMWDNSEALREAVGTLVDVLGTALAPVMDALGSLVESLFGGFDGLGEAAGFLGDKLAVVVLWLADRVPDAISATVDAYDTYLAPVLEVVVDLVGKVVDGFSDMFSTFTGGTGSIEGIGSSISGLLEPFGSLVEAVQALFRLDFDAASDALGEFFDGMSGPIKEAADWFGNTTDQLGKLWGVFADGEDVAQGVGEIIDNIFGNTGAFVGLARGFTQALLDLPGVILDGLKSLAQTIGSQLSNASDLTDAFIEWMRSGLDGLVEATADLPVVGPMVEAIRGLFTQVLQQLSGLLDIGAGIWSWDMDKIKEGIAGFGDAIVTALTETLPNLLVGAFDLSGILSGLFSDGLTTLRDSIPDIPIFDEIATYVLDGFRTAFDVLGGLSDVLAGIFSLDADRVLEGLGEIVTALTDWFGGLPLRIAEISGDVGETVISALGTVIGEWFPAAFTDATDKVADFIPDLFEWLKDLPENAANLIVEHGPTVAGAIIGGILLALKALLWDIPNWIITDLIPGIWDAFSGMADAGGDFISKLPEIAGAILGGMGRIALAIVTGIPGLFLSWIGSIGKGLLGLLKAAFRFVVDKGPTVLKALLGFVKSIPGRIFGLLKTLGTTFVDSLSNAFDFVVESSLTILGHLAGFLLAIPYHFITGLVTLGETLVGIFSGAFGWIVENGPTILAAVGDWLGSVPGKIIEWLGSIGEMLGGWITSAWDWVVENGPVILEAVAEWWVGMPGRIIGWLGSLGSLLQGWITGAWDWVVTNGPSVLQGILDWVKGVPGKIVTALGDLGSGVFDWLKGAFDTVKDRAGEAIAGLIDWAKGVPGSILNAIKDGIETIGGLASDVASAIWNALKNFINDRLLDPIRGFEVKIPMGPTFTPFSGIPQLAQGMVVTEPMTALVGEDGPEVVIPLTKPDRARQLVRESGLLDLLMGMIPQFADGGIISGPTLAVVGERGPEVIIPLDDAARARELALASGLLDVIQTQGQTDAVSNALKELSLTGVDASSPLLDWWEALPSRVISAMSNFGVVVWSAIRSTVEWLRDRLSDAFDVAHARIATFPTRVAVSLAFTGQTIWTAMAVGMGSFEANLLAVFARITAGVLVWRDALVSAINAIPSMIASVAAAIADAMAQPLRLFASTSWNPFARAMNEALSQIPATSAMSIPLLPTAHQGGIVGDDAMPRTGGPLGANEVIMRMERGEGIIPARAMELLSPAQFRSLQMGEMRGDFSRESIERYGPPEVLPGGVGDGPGSIRSVSATTMLPPSIAADFETAIRSLDDAIARVREGAFYLPTFLAEMFGDYSSAALGFVQDKVSAHNEDALASMGVPGGVFPSGFDVEAWRGVFRANKRDGAWPVLTEFLRATGIPHVLTSAYRPGSITVSGNLSNHARGRAIDVVGPSGGVNTPEMLRINQAFWPFLDGTLSELIYSGPGGRTDKAYGAAVMAGHHDHVHVALAAGGLIRRPTMGLLGEAGPEVVLPLTRPDRALQLALDSGLFQVLARARGGLTAEPSGADSPATVGAGQPGTTASADGGFLSGGPGNTYNIYGVTMDQVRAEIAARDRAALRSRT